MQTHVGRAVSARRPHSIAVAEEWSMGKKIGFGMLVGFLAGGMLGAATFGGIGGAVGSFFGVLFGGGLATLFAWGEEDTPT